MLNQTTHQTDFTMWMSTAQTHREAFEYESASQRRIYWDLNKAIMMLVNMLTLILGVAGNVMVLSTVCIRRLMHNPLSYYLANLAVVHTLLSLLVCPFFTFHVIRDAHFRRDVCAAFFILLYWLVLLVALTVLTIGLDRVWKERWSWHYLSRHSGRRALAVVGGCWTAALALVTALELTASAHHPLRDLMCPDGGGEAQQGQTAAPGDIAMEVIFYTSYGIAFICLMTVQILYGRKARNTGHLPGALTGDALLKVPEREAAAARETGGMRLNKRLFEDGDQQERSVRVLLLLVGTHTVCWLPFYVIYSINAHASTAFVPYHAVEMFHYLALLSSPLNPLLYYFSSVEFNMVMRQLVGAMCCRAASLSSGSTVTLEWESLQRLSDDQLRAFNADADRPISIGPTPSPSSALNVQKSTVAISAGSGACGPSVSRRELHEVVSDIAGPSADLYGQKNLPPPTPKRHRRRPSDSSMMEGVFQTKSPTQIAVGGAPSRSPMMTPTVMLTPAVDADFSESDQQNGDRPDSASPADSQHSGRSRNIMAGIRNLFRRERPSSWDRSESSQPSSRGGPETSQPASAAVTPDHAEKRGFTARAAALWHRRRIGTARDGQRGHRTDSEESLVRRLVLTGLPSGVVATRGGRHRRLSGVWRSPGGRLHRLDPEAEDYPVLLERMAATDSGYRTPTGQRIHHVCARHHVHGRCHHHGMRQAVTAPASRPRQQTSVGNWTAPGLVEEPPVHHPPPPVPPPEDSDSSSDSEGVDAVGRITNL